MPIDDTTAMLAYQARKKDALVAYLLWFFLSTLGVHRFYCNRVGSGVAMLVITLVSLPLMFVLIGFVTYFAVAIWWIVDAFLIPSWIQRHNELLIGQIEQARITSQGPPALTGGSLPPPRQ